jgi:hypothetical protein
MAFREAVAAEALDLGKAARGEIRVIAALQHAADEAVAESADGAHPLEGGERTAQPVGLGRGEARRDHGDLHRLLLEQRHAIGAAKHFHHGGTQILDPSLPCRRLMKGCTMPPWIGPGRTMATSQTRS